MPVRTDTVGAALAFLAERQLPSGRFCVRTGLDLTDGRSVDDPAALFATSLIARSLGFSDSSTAAAMRRRAAGHLLEHMEPGAEWRHWTREHPRHRWLPADLDDTALSSSVLRAEGIPMPDNSGLLLAGRDRTGRFRTWILPRWPPPRDVGFWRVAARRWGHPVESRRFWRTSAEPGDVDCVVNANVLSYLGDGPHAQGVAAYLLDVLGHGAEDRCDKWYRRAFVFHYALSRCAAAGVTDVEPARDFACARIQAAAHPDGRIGSGPLDTALAACALANWEAGGDEGDRARRYLAATQSDAGSWPAEPFYHGGPRTDRRVPCWGSEELTTAFCLEALTRA